MLAETDGEGRRPEHGVHLVRIGEVVKRIGREAVARWERAKKPFVMVLGD